MLKYLLLLCSTVVFAQSTVSISKNLCSSADPTSSKVTMYVPATVVIGGQTVNVSAQVCAKIGTGLSIATAADGSVSLNATLPPAITLPRQVVEKFQIPTNLLPTDTTVTFPLSKVPAPDTSIIYMYRASVVGADVSDAIIPVAGTKTVTITLPQHRPFTAGDVITLLYWTVQ